MEMQVVWLSKNPRLKEWPLSSISSNILFLYFMGVSWCISDCNWIPTLIILANMCPLLHDGMRQQVHCRVQILQPPELWGMGQCSISIMQLVYSATGAWSKMSFIRPAFRFEGYLSLTQLAPLPISFFSLRCIDLLLESEIYRKMKRQKNRVPICWFTHQVPINTGAKHIWSQEPGDSFGSLKGVQGPRFWVVLHSFLVWSNTTNQDACWRIFIQ